MQMAWGARASSPAAFGVPPKASEFRDVSPKSESFSVRGQSAGRRLEAIETIALPETNCNVPTNRIGRCCGGSTRLNPALAGRRFFAARAGAARLRLEVPPRRRLGPERAAGQRGRQPGTGRA